MLGDYGMFDSEGEVRHSMQRSCLHSNVQAQLYSGSLAVLAGPAQGVYGFDDSLYDFWQALTHCAWAQTPRT